MWHACEHAPPEVERDGILLQETAWPRVEVLRCAGPLDLDHTEDFEGALVVGHDDPHRLPEGTCGSSAVMESEAVGRAGG